VQVQGSGSRARGVYAMCDFMSDRSLAFSGCFLEPPRAAWSAAYVGARLNDMARGGGRAGASRRRRESAERLSLVLDGVTASWSKGPWRGPKDALR